jgi:dihydroorotate dehydrogenase electron transfer subunit
LYWGRKPITDLMNIFGEIKNGDIVLDPFCGGGNPTIAALMKGGRVIAGDLNPMATFLTRVLIRPINLAILKSAFEVIGDMVSRSILEQYKIQCPHCKKGAIIEYLVWANRDIKDSRPEAAQVQCRQCGKKSFFELSSSEEMRQIELSQIHTRFWFPKTLIRSTRIPPVDHHYELFTGRNLSMLAELLHAIKLVSSQNLQDALLYVFTAILYNCSSMQMFSEKEPSSSRGWTALRFYIPPKRKEVNVWHAFERRFDRFIKSKSMLNQYLSSVRITDSPRDFYLKKCDALISNANVFELIQKFGKRANFVFLDPPYIKDIDYFGFSEFWGAWLQMQFDFDNEWHPQKMDAEPLEKLLLLLSEVISNSCDICLAFAPKHKKGWEEAYRIIKSKYHIKKTGYFYYDHSHKRGVISNLSNRFFILESNASKKKIAPSYEKAPHLTLEVNNVQQLFPYLRVIDHLRPHLKTGPEKTLSLAAQFVPDRLSTLLRQLKEDDIEKAISNRTMNTTTYHTLCYSLLRMILLRDNWDIVYVDPTQFEDKVFGMLLREVNCVSLNNVPKGVAFVAQKDNKKLLFCFDDQDAVLLRNISTEIVSLDNEKFENICVMIVSSFEKMQTDRQVVKVDRWPRGFFVSFPEIQKKSEKLYGNKYLELCARTSNSILNSKEPSNVLSLTATVSNNIPVGLRNPNHYKLRFKTSYDFNILPGQFIMTATAPRRRSIQPAPKRWGNIKSSFKLEPTSFLKRPFGIHRAFYPHFGSAYLKKLSLPPALATVMHTVFPNEFEIFYKVLKNGVGTKELTKLKKGDEIEIMGPLGRRLNMREIRAQGFEEIHVIGGGVGMAPLIFMVQALRYYSYSIKAFIGIETIEMLKYKHDTDGLGVTFSSDPADATIYIDDLIDTGIDPADIYVSSTTGEEIGDMIPKHNFYKGIVSEQYKNYLKNTETKRKIAAFACGPMLMLKALTLITTECKIPLKVLMEKRMACGIGVCLSCVCETKNGKGKYSRVCTDGPIFDASEILWEKIH